METSSIRLDIKNKRNSISATEVSEKSNLVQKNLKALLNRIHRRADSFLCYYPANNEVDLLDFYQELLKEGYNLFFPKTQKKTMEFLKISSLDDFELGNFNIMEPVSKEKYQDVDNTICFTPLVAFDENRNRIGYGGGFYDRFFVNRQSIIKIGIAYDFQKIDKIVPTAWDIPLDYVVTNEKIY